MLQPENKATLMSILSYHVIAGTLGAKELMEKIKAGGGKASLKTVQGAELNFMMKGKELLIMDAKGGIANETIKDVHQSNGVMHVINKVLMP